MSPAGRFDLVAKTSTRVMSHTPTQRQTRNRSVFGAVQQDPESDRPPSESKRWKTLIAEGRKSVRNRWHSENSFSAQLSDEDNDTDVEFCKKRAKHVPQYAEIIKGLDAQPYRLFFRRKAHPKPPRRTVAARGERKLAIAGCLFIPGTSLVVTCAGNSIAITDCDTGEARALCMDPYSEMDAGCDDKNFLSIALAPLPQGNVIATGGNVHLLLVAKPFGVSWVADWSAHQQAVGCVAFVPNTMPNATKLHLLTGSEDSTICVWLIETSSWSRSLLARYTESGSIGSISVSPTGSMFWTAPQGCFWRLNLGESSKVQEYSMQHPDVMLHQEPLYDCSEVCFLDSKRVVRIAALCMHAPRRIHISQLAPSTTAKHTLKIVASFEIHESELKRDEAWQPWRRLSLYTEGNARYVVCGGRDGSVLFFNSHHSKEKPPRPVESFRLRHPQCMRPVTAVAVRADGLYVVACNSKNTIAIWKRERDASDVFCKLPASELQPAPPPAAQAPS